MFLIYNHTLWNVGFLGLLLYCVLLFSSIVYLIPLINFSYQRSAFYKFTKVVFVHNLDMLRIFLVFCIFVLFLNTSWVSPNINSWFSHLLFSNYQHKIINLLLLFFALVVTCSILTTIYSSQAPFDSLNVYCQFFLWILVLFMTNSLLTFIFCVEISSALIFLLIVSVNLHPLSTGNTRNMVRYGYFSNLQQITFLHSLLFFFWISLISSLNLFLSLILFFTEIQSFDWFLFELIFDIGSRTPRTVLSLTFVWFNLIFCLFLKCGMVPFFFWKPIFFKGLPLSSIFFYIIFFFPSFLLILVYLMLSIFSEILSSFPLIFMIILFFGIAVIFSIMVESFFIKTFLAVSSILNSLFIFLILASIF